MNKRIIFMGTPTFALPSLQALVAADMEIVGVFSQPPRPAGRGHKVQPSPVHAWAEEQNLPVFTPEKLTEEVTAEMKALRPDLICVAAYGLLLPQRVLDVAPCINVHPSALPRWRGAAPLQHSILAGDATTDLCIMAMEKGMDTGAVYLRETYPILPGTTAGKLHDDMAKRGATALVHVVQNWPMAATPQAAEGVTYAHKITPEMRPIDFTKTAHQVANHVNGLAPTPGATAELVPAKSAAQTSKSAQAAPEILKILQAQVSAANPVANSVPGTIVQAEEKLVVACGQGAVEFLTLQRPGKAAQNVREFLCGFLLEEGAQFS